ncbi:hypothetical protein HDU89_001357, partial [Geranomyces variabilis]
MNINSRTSSGIRTLDRTNLVSPLITNSLRGNGEKVSIKNFDKGEFNTLSNANGELKVNDIIANSDNIHISSEDGVYSVEVDSVVYNPPLMKNVDGSVSLAVDESLKVSHNILGLDYTDPLYINTSQQLSLDIDDTLHIDNQGRLSVTATDTLVDVKAPITRDPSGVLGLKFGKGLEEKEGALLTIIEEVVKPLGAIHTSNILDTGLNEALDYGFNSILEMFDGDIPDAEATILKLKTSDDFTQKGVLSGFKVLAMKNKGAKQIPYYANISDELNTDSSFTYNSTLNTLHVGHVEMTQDFNPSSNNAVTKSYVEQYVQSGSAIDVEPESNNRRLLNIRTDASLAVDANNNLQVNPSAIVDDVTTHVVDGKIAAIELTASNGVQRVENDFSLNLSSKNAQILVDNEIGQITGNIETKADSGLSMNENVIDLDKSALIDGNTITVHNGKLTGNLYHFGDGFVTDVQSDGNNSVTLDLEGSEHIQIQNNKILTDLKPFTAGENITISNNVISATVPEATSYSAGPGLTKIGNEFVNALSITGTMGIIVTGSAETGYILASEGLKSKRTDDDEDTKTDNDSSETLKASNSNPEVVEATGAIASLVPLALTPLTGLGAIGAAPAAIAGGLYGLLGGLAAGAGAAGLFRT